MKCKGKGSIGWREMRTLREKQTDVKKDGRSVTFSLPGRLRCEQLMTQTTVRSIHFTDLFT